MTARVALTGGIGTGKSHVRAEFERLGVPTIDADALARQAVAPGSAGHTAVLARFGGAVLDADGHIDRRRLGALVFADPSARQALESIVHPFVREAIDAWFAALEETGTRLGIADIPLLYEAGRDRDFDRVIVVACAPATQLQRVMRRDALSEPEARLRVAAQLPIEEKVARADYVIWTDGSFEETAAAVEHVLGELVGS